MIFVFFPVRVGERLAQLLPRSCLHVMPNGQHDLAHVHPEWVAALIDNHLGTPLACLHYRVHNMTTNFNITRALASDAEDIAPMVGELLAEIMNAINVQAFNFDLAETTSRLKDFLGCEKYFVFVARRADGVLSGFVALYESYALYAEGAFGTIAELYVRPECRTNGLGHHLVSQAKFFGLSRVWTRLEVTTPPLPQFDRTLVFYEREGFAISGGRKLKALL